MAVYSKNIPRKVPFLERTFIIIILFKWTISGPQLYLPVVWGKLHKDFGWKGLFSSTVTTFKSNFLYFQMDNELKRKRSNSDPNVAFEASYENDTEPSCKRQQITKKFQSTQRHDSIPNIIQLSKHIARVSFLDSWLTKLFMKFWRHFLPLLWQYWDFMMSFLPIHGFY